MIYDSLRVFAEEKRRALGLERRTAARGDLKAATVMRDRGLWLNRDKRIVGSIPGVYVGDLFFFRMELCVVGLHGQSQAGIDYVTASHSSNGEPIATSVIVSGGPRKLLPSRNVYVSVSGGYINQLDSRAWFESGPFISHFGYFWVTSIARKLIQENLRSFKNMFGVKGFISIRVVAL